MEKFPITYTELVNDVIVGTVLRDRRTTDDPDKPQVIYKKFDETGWRPHDPQAYNKIVDWLKTHVQDPHLRGIAFEVSRDWAGKERLKALLKGFAEEDNPHLFVFKEK